MTKAAADTATAIHPRKAFPAFCRLANSMYAKFHSPEPDFHPAMCSASSVSDMERSCDEVNWIGMSEYLDEVEKRLKATYLGGDGNFLRAAKINPADLAPIGHLLAIDLPRLLVELRMRLDDGRRDLTN